MGCFLCVYPTFKDLWNYKMLLRNNFLTFEISKFSELLKEDIFETSSTKLSLPLPTSNSAS